VRSLAGGDRPAQCTGRGDLRRMGLAAALPAVRDPAGGLVVDPPAAAGKPGVPADEGNRHDLKGATDGSLRAMAQRALGPGGPAWRSRWPGSGLVHRPVLRAVLSD